MSKKNSKEESKSDIVFKDETTEYGYITKKLGNGRFLVRIMPFNKEVMGRICGKFRKGSKKKENFVDIDTVVLVGLRDYQDDIVDIVHIYDSNEARKIRKEFEIQEKEIEEDGFDFSDI